MKNKKGNINNILMFSSIIILIMGVGLIMALSGSMIKNFTSTVLPGLTSLPNINGQDLGGKISLASASITTINNALPVMLGVVYMLALVGVLGLAYAFRISGEKYLLVPFLLLGILVILGSIIISNTYENFYRSGTTLAQGLQEMTLLSWLLLYSPVVITILFFIGGAIIFSGFEEVAV